MSPMKEKLNGRSKVKLREVQRSRDYTGLLATNNRNANYWSIKKNRMIEMNSFQKVRNQNLQQMILITSP